MASVADHDMIVNLGDIVGYGASPNEVSDRSRELCDIFVRGNHDKACTGLGGIDDFNPIAGMAAIWTQQTLTPENFEWLRALPQGFVELGGVADQEPLGHLAEGQVEGVGPQRPEGFVGARGEIPDQSGLGGAAARWRLARRLRPARYQRKPRHVLSRSLRREKGPGADLFSEAAG